MDNLAKTAKAFIMDFWQADADRACLPEYANPHCLHRTILGKSIGTASFKTTVDDWCRAFPDCIVKTGKATQHGNFVSCSVEITASYQAEYVCTNNDPQSVLSTSQLGHAIQATPPNGARYLQPAELLFFFEEGKISQIYVEEDHLSLYHQLGFEAQNGAISQGKFDLQSIEFLASNINQRLQSKLSKKELECLALSFCGLTAKHIGQFLDKSYRTIETHLHNAYQKLGCSRKV